MSTIDSRFESACSKDILKALGIQDANDIDCGQVLDVIQQQMVAIADEVSLGRNNGYSMFHNLCE